MSGQYRIGGESLARLVESIVPLEELSPEGSCSHSNDEYGARRVKRMCIQSSSSGSRPKRGQANKRERVRTENVNAGFEKLRRLIPTDPIDRKLSKIEILRLATSYISHLFNLTRANSCLEAEKMDRNEETSDGEVIDNDPKRPSDSTKSKLKHMIPVCTFCLMITKGPTHRKR